MAFLPWFRITIFTLITIFSLVTLGMGAYVENNAYVLDWDYTPIILVSSCLTSVTLPLFLGLGGCQGRVFTSTILFEFIWFLFLSLLWAATAIFSLFASAYCGDSFLTVGNGVTIDQACGVAYIGSIIAFVPCGLAFIYDQVILCYAIINALRGKRIWTVSVKEAATNVFNTVNPIVQFVVPTVQPDYATTDAPPIQPYYNSTSEQVPPSSQPSFRYPYVFFRQPYNAPQMPPRSQ